MGFSPFRSCRNDPSVRGQATQHGDGSDAGRAAKIPCTEKCGMECQLPPTAPELGAVPIPRKESGDGKGGWKGTISDGSALDEKGKACPLTRDVVKRGPENVS